MHVRLLFAMTMLAGSTAALGAQPSSFTSAEGRSMSFELFASNRSPFVVTIDDVHAYSGQSSGKRQHQPIRIRQSLPAGAMEVKGTGSGALGPASAQYMEMEQIAFTFLSIVWKVNGVEQRCEAKVPASYRASDKRVVARVGDVASLMTPDGRPIPSKCQGS